MKKVYYIRVYAENGIHSFILLAKSMLAVYTEFSYLFKGLTVDFKITCISDFSLEQTLQYFETSMLNKNRKEEIRWN
ncbi:hypothetical protein [Listeria seeligeri]|uniref:hypothetical protein n=1 Tax=Listeria seeligeri TaxID=1640 RepID=UPI0022EB507A|nr:hypothetical protein [Listeria seeligeri]